MTDMDGAVDDGTKDVCGGDSGGPLACDYNGKAVLAGVVSFGAYCSIDETSKIGAYARVTHVLDWIKENMV